MPGIVPNLFLLLCQRTMLSRNYAQAHNEVEHDDTIAANDQERAERDGSSGLGLNIVKTVVEAMGGAVAAESTPGSGTVFTVRFAELTIACGLSGKQTVDRLGGKGNERTGQITGGE